MKRLLLGVMAVAGWCVASVAAPIPKLDEAALARLRRDERFAARGQVDLFVASTAALKFKDDDDRRWAPATKLGAKVLSLAEPGNKNFDSERMPHGGPAWFGDFATYKKTAYIEGYVCKTGVYKRPAKNKDGHILLHEAIQAVGVEAGQSISGLIVSRGPVTAPQCIKNALVLATGDVKYGTREKIANSNIVGADSVIVCDGDLETKTLSRCIVIARGNIRVTGGADYCTLIAEGTVTVGSLPNPPQRGEDPADAFRRRAVIKEKESHPLGFITFFELHRIGLEVKATDGAVRVAKLTAGQACAKAGMKVGDTILEVAGKKPTDAESLRRLLRDALAVGDASVKIQRGKETLSVRVSLPE